MEPTSSDPTTPYFLAYDLATPVERMQAMTHAIAILEPRFPSISLNRWVELFDRGTPLLWKAATTVQVERDALAVFADWVDWNVGEKGRIGPPSYEGEAFYLANNLILYQQMAQEVIENVQVLSNPQVDYTLRSLIYRLAGGNSVAEKVHWTQMNHARNRN